MVGEVTGHGAGTPQGKLPTQLLVAHGGTHDVKEFGLRDRAGEVDLTGL